MQKTKVINLGQVRDLLAHWEAVRTAIVAGEVVGFHAALRGPEGGEAIYIGGVYREDPQAATQAALRASAARMLTEDSPLLARSS